MFATLAAVAPAASDAVSRDATQWDWVLLGVYLALAIGVSFLCSMLEAGLLSLPQSHVELMAREGRRGGKRLKRMKQNIDRPLAAILTLNTVAHTIGAAGVGAQILIIFGNGAVAIGSVIVTLLILVFSEIIPKSIGAAKARSLAPFTALAIQVMIWVTYLLLIPLQWISSKLGGGHVNAMTREEVAVTAELGHTAGVIGQDEVGVIRNILGLRKIPVSQIMTPRPVVFALPAGQTVQQVLDEHQPLPYTRMPVIEQDKDHVLGYVTRPALLQARHEGQTQATMADLQKPLGEIDDSLTVMETFNQLVRSRRHLLRVVDKFGGTAGVVSLEDCIETILGKEIVDETDTAPDLRAVAENQHRSSDAPPDANADTAADEAPTPGASLKSTPELAADSIEETPPQSTDSAAR
jgi:CBS domain containing-hemolysin-like protein